jgi:hypothetical protein
MEIHRGDSPWRSSPDISPQAKEGRGIEPRQPKAVPRFSKPIAHLRRFLPDFFNPWEPRRGSHGFGYQSSREARGSIK